MRLLFATQNPNKIAEIQPFMPPQIELLGLHDLNFTEPLAEDGNTLEANALQKVRFIYEQFGYNCFADDTGLEVHALNGAPGVDSAHYAGPQRAAADNMRKLLHEMRVKENRAARFRSVFALIWDGEEFLFEGTVAGTIISQPRGTMGFGYDPIFQPEGHAHTFAEMGKQEKNSLSHRGRALAKLIRFLIGRGL